MANQKKIALRLLVLQSLGSGVNVIMAVPTRLVNAYFLGASGLGILKVAELIQQYGSYADFGLTGTLVRQIPLALGRNDPAKADRIRDVVLSCNGVTSLLGLAAIWAAYMYGMNFKGTLDVTIMILISAWYLLCRAGAYLHTLAKGVGAFDLVGREALLTSVVTPLFLIPGVILFRIYGAMLGYCLIQLCLVLLYTRLVKQLVFRLKFPLNEIRELFGVGVLIYANRFANVLFWTVDTTALAWFLQPADVGQYAFAMSILGLAVNIASSLNVVAYRQMLLARGDDGNERTRLGKYLGSPFVSQLMLSAAVLGVSYFGYSAMVRLFVPQFLPSLSVARVLVMGQMVFAATYFTSLYFNVTDQMGWRAVITFVCLGLNLVLDVCVLKRGMGLFAVAWASTISYILFSSILVVSSLRQVTGKRAAPAAFFLRLLAIAFVLLAALHVLDGSAWITFHVGVKQLMNVVLGLCDAALKILVFSVGCVTLYSVLFYQHRPYRDIQFAAAHMIQYGRGLLSRVSG